MTEQTSPPSPVTYLEAFETTSACRNETQAVALINFAALFHERVYINDTVLGDSDALIRSYLAAPGGGRLYRIARSFIAEGILVPHWRDQFSVTGESTTRQAPTLVDLYGFWKQRDAIFRERGFLSANEDLFTCDIHGDKRIAFYEDLDPVIRDARDEHHDPRWRYSVDAVKTRFRDNIRTLIDSDSLFRDALRESGRDIELRYRAACNETYFTVANLWHVTRHSPETTRQLSRVQGMVNQEAYAHAAATGMQGLDDQTVSGASLAASLDLSLLAARLKIRRDVRGPSRVPTSSAT